MAIFGFDIPYLEYILPVLVIFIIAFVVRYIYKRSQSGRIGLENIKIKQEKESLSLDTKVRKMEKFQRDQALRLSIYYGELKEKAFHMGFNSLRKLEQFKLTEEGLKKLKNENITVPQAITILRQIREQKNIILADLPLSQYDRESLLPKIEEAETELYNALIKEYNDLKKEIDILKQEEEETQRELAA